MHISDFTNISYGAEAYRRFYIALIGWFKRANLLQSWINYQQDIELLVANFTHDYDCYRGEVPRAGPADEERELQKFLLWQLPRYTSFDEEDTPARSMLDEVVERVTALELEDALAVLDPVGKCDLEQLRASCDKRARARSDRQSDLRPGAA